MEKKTRLLRDTFHEIEKAKEIIKEEDKKVEE
jgi:hypothetical protein